MECLMLDRMPETSHARDTTNGGRCLQRPLWLHSILLAAEPHSLRACSCYAPTSTLQQGTAGTSKESGLCHGRRLTRVLATGLPSSSTSTVSSLTMHMMANGMASWGPEPIQILTCGAMAETASSISCESRSSFRSSSVCSAPASSRPPSYKNGDWLSVSHTQAEGPFARRQYRKDRQNATSLSVPVRAHRACAFSAVW